MAERELDAEKKSSRLSGNKKNASRFFFFSFANALSQSECIDFIIGWQFCIASRFRWGKKHEKKRDVCDNNGSESFRIAWKLAGQHIHKGRSYRFKCVTFDCVLLSLATTRALPAWFSAVQFYSILFYSIRFPFFSFDSLRFSQIANYRAPNFFLFASFRSVSSVRRIAQKCNAILWQPASSCRPIIFWLYQKNERKNERCLRLSSCNFI